MSPSQTPTRKTERMFNQLNIRATSPLTQLSSKSSKALETPPTSPESDKAQSNTILPTELRDLLSLHASFLTALSLHSAHTGGSTAAVSIKTLHAELMIGILIALMRLPGFLPNGMLQCSSAAPRPWSGVTDRPDTANVNRVGSTSKWLTGSRSLLLSVWRELSRTYPQHVSTCL